MATKMRPANIEDCDAIAELGAAAAQGDVDYLFEGVAAGRSAIEMFAEHIKGRYSQFNYENTTVVEVEGDIAGMIIVAPSGKHPDASYPGVPEQRLEVPGAEEAMIREGYWHVEMVAVKPEFGGRGLARQLLAEAERGALEGGYQGVSLTVDEQNRRAVDLYLRYGFEEVDRIPRHPAADPARGDVLLLIKPGDQPTASESRK